MDNEQREKAIAELNYSEAPRMTNEFPGPKAKEIFAEGMALETYQRAAGLAWPIVAEEARGACIKDVDGNIIIDGCASIAVVGVGHNHPKVVEAIRDQAGKYGHIFDLTSPIKVELIKKMVTTAPPGLKDDAFVAFGMSGTAAAEIAVKQARMITGRTEVCAFEGAYHGVFGAANAMTTGSRYRRGYGPLMPGVFHVPYPYCYRCPFDAEYPKCDMLCAKFVDYQLNTPNTGKDDVALIIAEGMQCEGGYVVAPQEWWPMMRKVADKNGCLLAVDEVQSGFGKSGKLWIIEHYDCRPDIVTFAKAVGGDQPVAGAITRSSFADKLQIASQPMTFTGNAISLAASLANYEIMLDPELDLMGRATRLGEEFQALMKEAQKTNEVIGDIRGLGLLQAIELVKDPATREPVDSNKVHRLLVGPIMERGLWLVGCGRYGNVIRFMPPLTITHEHFLKSVEIIVEVLKENQDDLRN
ncbi:MAG: aspartate aminotransferase family protein [Proteobacteria bacterium]|nr:aspartate aminotransferase family protein [Pseudomonadota bacterium]